MRKSIANQLQITANQSHVFQCFSVRWFLSLAFSSLGLTAQNAPKMHDLTKLSCDFLRFCSPKGSHNSATTQPQLSWVVKHVFERLSCTFQGLSCTLQLTTTQSLLTFKKHYKTRATHCKSLQLTSLQTWSARLWGRKAHIFWKLAVLLLQLACAHSQTCHVVSYWRCYKWSPKSFQNQPQN